LAQTNLGTHMILELYGCPFDLLDDEEFVRQSVREASERALSPLLKLSSHKFSPQGVTALGLLAESHISIHTWPEMGYAAADIFTCGTTAMPRLGGEYLVERFRAASHCLTVMPRGEIPSIHRAPNVIEHMEAQQCPALD